jgi:hypothetical protein
MNQPNWQAAEGSACASWQRVGIVVPGALVKNWCQLSNITVSLALKPNIQIFVADITRPTMMLYLWSVRTVAATQSVTFLHILDHKQDTNHNINAH